MIAFTIPGQPAGKGRPRAAKRGNYVTIYSPSDTVRYENYIKFLYQSVGGKLHTGPLKLHIKAYFLVPGSWSQRKRLKALGGEIRPTVKPDVDNIIKVVCDALNKIAYADDKQIINISCSKFYDVAPRVEVTIQEAAHE